MTARDSLWKNESERLAGNIWSMDLTYLNLPETLDFGERELINVLPTAPRVIMTLENPLMLTNFVKDDYGKYRAKFGFGRSEELSDVKVLNGIVENHSKRYWVDRQKLDVELRTPEYKGTVSVQLPNTIVDGKPELAHGSVIKLDDSGMFWDNLNEIIEMRGLRNRHPTKVAAQLKMWARRGSAGKVIVGYSLVLDGITF